MMKITDDAEPFQGEWFISKIVSWREYADTNNDHIQALKNLSYAYPSKMRRSRGDGNCFYFAFLYGLLRNMDHVNLRTIWLQEIHTAVEILKTFPTIGMLNVLPENFFDPNTGGIPIVKEDPHDLTQFRKMVMGLRYITARHLFKAILFDRNGEFMLYYDGGRKTPFRVLQTILTINTDAEHQFIQLLANAFDVSIRIEDLDNKQYFGYTTTFIHGNNREHPPGKIIYLLRNGVHYDYIETPTIVPSIRHNVVPQNIVEEQDPLGAFFLQINQLIQKSNHPEQEGLLAELQRLRERAKDGRSRANVLENLKGLLRVNFSGNAEAQSLLRRMQHNALVTSCLTCDSMGSHVQRERGTGRHFCNEDCQKKWHQNKG